MKIHFSNSASRLMTLGFLLCLSCACIVESRVFANDADKLTISDTPIPQRYEQEYQAAIAGSAEAQFQIGLLFEYGRGVNQDDSIATKWYEKSAAQGFSNAQYRLAVLYENGWGKAADKKLAFKFYKSAAENGHELAQHDLAIMYFNGAGVEKNHVHAYKWLRVAVLSGSALMEKHLNMVALEMSPEEIEIAEYLAKIWIERSSI